MDTSSTRFGRERRGQRSIVPLPAPSVCAKPRRWSRHGRSRSATRSQEEPYGPLRRDVRLLGSLLGRVLVEQEGEAFLAAEERIRASARRSREIGDPVLRPGGGARAAARGAGRDAAGVRDATSSSRTPPSSTTGIRRRRELCRRGRRRRASRSTRRSSGWPSVPADELVRERLAHVSLELVLTAHPTEATRRTMLRAHVRIAGLLTRLDDPDLTPAERAELEDELAEEITILWQTDEVRERAAAASATRSGTGSGSSRRACSTPASGCSASYRELAPGAPAAALVRQLDRRRPRRQPGGRPRRRSWRRSSGRASRRSRATAPTSGRSRSRSRRARSLVGVSEELLSSIARDVRECPPAIDDAGADDERRGLPAEALVHVVAARQRRLRRAPRSCSPTSASSGAASRRTAASGSAGGALAALERRVELFGFHLAKLDVRLHASEVRAPTERTRGVFEAVALARAPPRRSGRSTR